MNNKSKTIIRMIGLLSLASGVCASDGKKETPFFNSGPANRTSFRKEPPPGKLIENVRGLYYIVDASSFVKADTDRNGPYRSLGSTILVDEALLTKKGGTKQ